MKTFKLMTLVFVALLSPPRAFADDAGSNAPYDKTNDQAETKRLLHGFRLGYLYVSNIDHKVEGRRSLREEYNMVSPHQFVFGYEVTWRMVGHDWLNVLLVGNFLIAGIEQSQFYPSGNGLVGFELNNSFQVAVGANLTPSREKEAHMLLAAGWTPRVGDFYVPVHAFFVPDVDRNHRAGVTVGVNF